MKLRSSRRLTMMRYCMNETSYLSLMEAVTTPTFPEMAKMDLPKTAKMDRRWKATCRPMIVRRSSELEKQGAQTNTQRLPDTYIALCPLWAALLRSGLTQART